MTTLYTNTRTRSYALQFIFSSIILLLDGIAFYKRQIFFHQGITTYIHDEYLFTEDQALWTSLGGTLACLGVKGGEGYFNNLQEIVA